MHGEVGGGFEVCLVIYSVNDLITIYFIFFIVTLKFPEENTKLQLMRFREQ